MKSWIRVLVAACVFAGFIAPVAAQERATQAEAKALSQAAADHVKKVGAEQAFKDFTDRKNAEWRKKDLYVVAYNGKGDCLAHGGVATYVGQNHIEAKDPKGVPIVANLVEAAAKGEESVNYEVLNPKTDKIEPKTTYVHKIDGDAMVGVGAYR